MTLDTRQSTRETQYQAHVALNVEQRYYPLNGVYGGDSSLNYIFDNEILYELVEDQRPHEYTPQLQSVVTGRGITHY